MTFMGWLTIALFAIILTTLAMPLGRYMARVYSGERVFLTPLFAGPERFLYALLRVDSKREQDWKTYAKSRIVFSLAGGCCCIATHCGASSRASSSTASWCPCPRASARD